MQLPAKDRLRGTFIERFLDATHTVEAGGPDHPLPPAGRYALYTLSLHSGGRLELHVREHRTDGRSAPGPSHLIVRGGWELRGLEADRFAIRIRDPEFEIVARPEAAPPYVQAIRSRHCLWLGADGAFFDPELPHIAGNGLIFAWDQLEWDSLIRYGDLTVWRERTGFEVYDRFVEMAAALKRKYGRRVIDLVPTPRSHYALYGDTSRASGHVQRAREMLGSD